jgi:hypothetical protein
MKVRVHELAKEFGVPSKTVLETLKDMGEFVKTASSPVEAPVVRRLIEQYGNVLRAQAAHRKGSPSAGNAPARRPVAREDAFDAAIRDADQPTSQDRLRPMLPRHRRRTRWRGPVPREAQPFLPPRAPLEGYFAAEVEQARARANAWLVEFFDADNIAEWQRVCPGITPQKATELLRLGVALRHLETPLWYGRVQPGSSTLGARLGRGELSVAQVFGDLKAAGLLRTS